MKKILFVIGLILLVALFMGCGGKKKVAPVEETTKVETGTTPPPPPPPPPTQPETKPGPMESDFKTIFFDFDKYNIRADQMGAMEANAALLKEHGMIRVKIEGHCDERGTNEYNLRLGERRAKSIMSYLIEMGIPADRMEMISYGEEMSADPGHDEGAWARNRRGQFRILGG